MEDHPLPKNPSKTWAFSIIVALLLYPLSIGPVAMIGLKLHLSFDEWREVRIFYKPLARLAEVSGCLKAANAYVNWWYGWIGEVPDPFGPIVF